MVNKDALHKIYKLEMEYENCYGKKPDYSMLPKEISQEKMIHILEYMIKTNKSLAVAYGELFSEEKE